MPNLSLSNVFPSVVCISNHTFLPLLDENQVVLDFGAYLGDFSREIVSRFGCRTIAVEPIPYFAERLSKDDNLTVVEAAISDRVASQTLNIYKQVCATTLDRDVSGETPTPIEVKTVTLAHLRREYGLDRIGLLKVDIEGAELPLLEGASDEDLSAIDQLTIEFHDFIWPEHAKRISAIKKRLSDSFWIIRWSRRNDGDVLFINRRLGVSSFGVVWLRSYVKYSRGIGRIIKALLYRE